MIEFRSLVLPKRYVIWHWSTNRKIALSVPNSWLLWGWWMIIESEKWVVIEWLLMTLYKEGRSRIPNTFLLKTKHELRHWRIWRNSRRIKEGSTLISMIHLASLVLWTTFTSALIIHSDKDYYTYHSKATFGLQYGNQSTLCAVSLTCSLHLQRISSDSSGCVLKNWNLFERHNCNYYSERNEQRVSCGETSEQRSSSLRSLM